MKSAEITSDGSQLNVYYPPGDDRIDSEYMRSYILDKLTQRNKEKILEMDPGDLYDIYVRITRLKHVSRGGSAGVMTRVEDSEYVYFDSDNYSGDIFYGGLGLELNINKLCMNSNVSSIDIVERSADIIKLISPRIIDNDKVTIHHADPMRYFHKQTYDFMIWSQYQTWLYNIDGSCLHQQYLRGKYSNENI